MLSGWLRVRAQPHFEIVHVVVQLSEGLKMDQVAHHEVTPPFLFMSVKSQSSEQGQESSRRIMSSCRVGANKQQLTRTAPVYVPFSCLLSTCMLKQYGRMRLSCDVELV